MQLTVIGCGDAFSSGGQKNTCFLVTSENHNFLLDCGATSLLGLQQLKFDGSSIDTIIVSHFHGDHFGGIPFIIINRAFNQTVTKPLTIIGPPEIEQKVYDLQSQLYPNTETLFKDLKISFKEFEVNKHQTFDQFSLWTTKVEHSPASSPHGYKIYFDGKCLAYSGDTEWTDNLIELSSEADLFICECNDFEGSTPGHLSYETLGAKISQLASKRTIITHLGSKMINVNTAMDRLEDGMVIDL